MQAGLGKLSLVQFGMDSLRVAMLGPLNEQGHHPCRQGGDGMPIERLPLEQEPENAIEGADDEKRSGMCGEGPKLREVVRSQSMVPRIGASLIRRFGRRLSYGLAFTCDAPTEVEQYHDNGDDQQGQIARRDTE